MAIGRPVIFFSVSGGVGYRAYPISVSVAGANPCWKLKCGCCSSIDASFCCYMAAWLRLKSCVPRLYRFQIESTTVSTWHQYCYIIVVVFFGSRTAPRLFSCASISHDGLRCLFAMPHTDTVRTGDSWSSDEQNHNAEKGRPVGLLNTRTRCSCTSSCPWCWC